jgi:hypothetical protein
MKSEREGINTLVKPSGTGCAECLNTGGWWLHLRRCAGHPIITSFEPGERWFYDYRTGDFFAGPNLPAPHSHPINQPVPGPAGHVPSNWQTLLNE